MWLVHVGEWAVGESGVRQSELVPRVYPCAVPPDPTLHVPRRRPVSKSHTLALRCNRDYRIGRSEQRADKSFNEIRIEKKSVSRTAGTVLVGDWPEEDGRGEVDYLVRWPRTRVPRGNTDDRATRPRRRSPTSTK